jgi:hypothetical protein
MKFFEITPLLSPYLCFPFVTLHCPENKVHLLEAESLGLWDQTMQNDICRPPKGFFVSKRKPEGKGRF